MLLELPAECLYHTHVYPCTHRLSIHKLFHQRHQVNSYLLINLKVPEHAEVHSSFSNRLVGTITTTILLNHGTYRFFKNRSFCQPNNVLHTEVNGALSCVNTDGTAGLGPTNGTMQFKTACPEAYSYNFDDANSTFTCPTGSDYEVVFCP